MFNRVKMKRRATGNDHRWQAVLAHDATQDGRFVYAVRSTGVFCKPSCPSRRPGPEQVEFFETPAMAERAGYRACRRCRPGAESTVDALIKFIDGRTDVAQALNEFAQQNGVGVQHLRRLLRAKTGMTPGAFDRARRVERLKSNLRNGRSVTHAALAAGFPSPARLYERADRQLGMTPGCYRDGGRGVHIRYAVVDCSLGKLLVATTAKGVCAVKLGDTERPLVRELKQEFPAATITPGDVPALAQVLRLLDGRPTIGAVPLDMRGTLFQRTVWAALCAIRPGETRSYQQLAASVGRPTAARAVARACATNPVAVVVPCHRIVRGTGQISGYRWGVDRKKSLLERERRVQRRATTLAT